MTTSNSKKKAKSRNNLAGGERYKLTKWLDDNWDELVVGQGKTADDVARVASEYLDFTVRSANVSGAARSLERSFPRTGRGIAYHTRVSIPQLAVVCDQVATLAEHLGEQLGPDFSALNASIQAAMEKGRERSR